MAQRRMIAKSISTSKKVNRVSDKAALLFTWLIPHCDDYGRMDASPETVKAIVVPMRRWRRSDVAKFLEELTASGLIDLYEVDGEFYLQISKFGDFQTFKNDRERISLYPEKIASNNEIPMDSNNIHLDSYKLSEVKLSEVTSEVETSHEQITKLIDSFKEVNPSYRKWFANKTQRGAAKRLIDTHGFDKIIGIISFLPHSNGQPYIPSVTTPLQLEDKWAALEAAWKKKKIEVESKKPKVIFS